MCVLWSRGDNSRIGSSKIDYSSEKVCHLIDRPIIKTQSSKTLMDVHVAREWEIGIAFAKKVKESLDEVEAMAPHKQWWSTLFLHVNFISEPKKKTYNFDDRERTNKRKTMTIFFWNRNSIISPIQSMLSAVRATALDFCFPYFAVAKCTLSNCCRARFCIAHTREREPSV